jgi:hypothetical protein
MLSVSPHTNASPLHYMTITPELALATWGAVVSTGVAFFTIRKALYELPKIGIKASLIHSTLDDGDIDTHGVRVQVRHGDDLLWEEVNVEIHVSNAGLQAIQVVCAFVETPVHVFQIIPKGLPVVLEVNRGITLTVQPEFFAPPAKATGNEDLALTDHILAAGVIDALGKKHAIAPTDLEALVTACAALPLRIHTYKHKETGNLIQAFQGKDAFQLLRKNAG